MGCFRTIEVIAKKDLEIYLIPKIMKILKEKVIPELIHQLNMTEEKLDISSNKIEITL
jgi:hypothetical protein